MKSVNIAIISIVVVVSIAAIAIGYEVSSNETSLLSSLTGQPDSDTPELTKTSTDEKGTTGTGENKGTNLGTGTSKRTSGSGTSGSGSSSGTSSSGTGYTYKISSETAQKIANKNIEQSGFYAGTPRAFKGNYIVPILDPRSNERGYFLIDGTTGEIIEGAGGAP